MLFDSQRNKSNIALLFGGVVLGSILIYTTGKISAHLSFKKADVRVTIKSILERVQRDECERGISAFKGNDPLVLEKAAAALTKGGKVVVILTGFPALINHVPPTETDGPPGAFSIAKACIHIGKRVIMVTDDCNANVMMACTAGCGLKGSDFSLDSFPSSEKWDKSDEARLIKLSQKADIVVAIERPGPAKDGRYYTMKGLDMGKLVAPVDKLLKYVKSKGNEVPVIAIGDGGNEVGMGNVRSKIIEKSAIKFAPKVSCCLCSDHLIVCSVSNWGGYALAGALAALHLSDNKILNTTSVIKAMLPSELEERMLLERMVESGARDGITGEKAMSIDGLPFEVSLQILRDISSLLLMTDFSIVSSE